MTFKIFYSWQSDISKNRCFIQTCIDEAIVLAKESEMIVAERDEATSGKTGAPNIVTTLFSKIDDCDLFIADVTLCFSDITNNKKKSPNPNVLIELGYAVKTLGWERVICVCNREYGIEYPFDISHNRITTFSLDEKHKKNEKANLSKIILSNIIDLRDLPPKVRTGYASHIIGTYDFDAKKVISSIEPIEITKQEKYVLHNEKIFNESEQLYRNILEITIKHNSINSNEKEKEELPKNQLSSFSYQTETNIIWEDIQESKQLLYRWLGHNVSDSFFDLGDLRTTKPVLYGQRPSISGPNYLKEKYKMLNELIYNLMLLEIRKSYPKTFLGMSYIPIAIQNISKTEDSNIHITIEVVSGEIIEPSEKMLCEECQGMESFICRDEDEQDIGMIAELFSPHTDMNISIEDVP